MKFQERVERFTDKYGPRGKGKKWTEFVIEFRAIMNTYAENAIRCGQVHETKDSEDSMDRLKKRFGL